MSLMLYGLLQRRQYKIQVTKLPSYMIIAQIENEISSTPLHAIFLDVQGDAHPT